MYVDISSAEKKRKITITAFKFKIAFKLKFDPR